MNDKKVVVLMVFLMTSILVSGILFNNYTEGKLERKIESIAKQIELLKVDIEGLKVKSPVVSDTKNIGFNDLLSLQKKLADMKAQIENISKRKETVAVNEYKKKEERLLREHAGNVNKAWSMHLDQKLVGLGFEDGEREIVLADYQKMLENINDEQFKWYNGEITAEELTESTRVLGKELFDEMSETVGEQKASIALGVIFPDSKMRESFFKNE